MADKPTPVAVEVARLDSYLFPANFPIPLVESLVNQNGDLGNVAEQSNTAASSAYDANVKNEEQDTILISYGDAIDRNKRDIGTNTTNIATNAAGIAQNKQDIATNAGEIQQNATDIQSNTQAINQTNTNLSNHTGSNSQHGVTGDNVGTEDFCTATVGGVVLLAAEVADLVNYTAPAAPAAYDQTEEQAFRTGVETAINGIIAKVNEILAGQKSSKQMDSTP